MIKLLNFVMVLAIIAMVSAVVIHADGPVEAVPGMPEFGTCQNPMIIQADDHVTIQPEIKVMWLAIPGKYRIKANAPVSIYTEPCDDVDMAKTVFKGKRGNLKVDNLKILWLVADTDTKITIINRGGE